MKKSLPIEYCKNLFLFDHLSFLIIGHFGWGACLVKFEWMPDILDFIGYRIFRSPSSEYSRALFLRFS